MHELLKNESGRSMVEMLGVLAVIGFLAAMGLRGYTLAMNKYYASTLLNEAHKRAVTVSGQIGFGLGSVSISSFDNSEQGYGRFSGVTHDKTKKQFTLSISDVREGVCEQVKLLLAGNKTMGNSLPENCSGDNNEISLTFNEDLSEGDAGTGTQDDVARCEGGRIKCGDACCGENEICASTEGIVMPGDKSYGCREASQLACQTNATCGVGEYCKVNGTRCDVFSSAECASTSPSELTQVSLNGRTFYAGLVSMTSWWSAENFCLAHGKKLASLASLGLSKSYTGECLSWNCYVEGTDTEHCEANGLGSYTCTGMTNEECNLNGGEYSCAGTVANKADCAGGVEDECNQKGNGPLYKAFDAAGVAGIKYWVADRSSSCYSYRVYARSDKEWVQGDGGYSLLFDGTNYALCE